MATLEKRVAHLEGKVGEFVGVREALAQFEQRVDGRFETVDGRFEAIDRRFDAIDRRFETIDRRFEAIDRRFDAVDRRFDAVDRRFDAVDDKLSRQFQWLVGLQITTLVAIVGALLARS